MLLVFLVRLDQVDFMYVYFADVLRIICIYWQGLRTSILYFICDLYWRFGAKAPTLFVRLLRYFYVYFKANSERHRGLRCSGL